MEHLGQEHFPPDTSVPIGDKLPADWFYYKRDLAGINEDKQHLDRNLFPVAYLANPHLKVSTLYSQILLALQVEPAYTFNRLVRARHPDAPLAPAPWVALALAVLVAVGPLLASLLGVPMPGLQGGLSTAG